MRKLRRRIDPNTVVLLKHIGVGVVMVGVVVLLITGIWYGTRLPALTISYVEATGGETINVQSVERIVESMLEGEYIGLIPRRFAWLYPAESIQEAVGSLDRVHDVQLVRNGDMLHVTFAEYVPDALWCDTLPAERCLFIDENAYAFSVAPQLTGGSFMRFAMSERAAVVGETMLDVAVYRSLLELEQLLSAQGWFVSRIEIDQVGDAFLGLVDGGELKVAIGVPPQETVDNLSTVVASKQFSHLRPGAFVYIDLRFGNKVFVKETETATSDEVAEAELLSVGGSSTPQTENSGN